MIMALRFLTAVLVLSMPLAPVEAETYATRYGSLQTDDMNLLFFRGKPVRPRIEGINFLTFERKFEFPGYDLVLIQDVGGTACPAQFYIVKVSGHGAVGTRSFGSCSDIYQVNRAGNGLEIRMGGFMGPSATTIAHKRAARQKFSYRYAAGRIIERQTR